MAIAGLTLQIPNRKSLERHGAELFMIAVTSVRDEAPRRQIFVPVAERWQACDRVLQIEPCTGLHGAHDAMRPVGSKLDQRHVRPHATRERE